MAVRSSYDIIWDVNIYNYGHVQCDQDPGPFDRGEEVVITAVPSNNDVEFVRWSDGNTDNPRTLVANRDYDLVAEFHHKTQTRQLSVDAYYGETTGSGTYHIGDRVDITLTPNPGFHLLHWDDDETETSLTRSFYIRQNTPRYIQAVMESDATYHVRVVCDPPQAGTVTGCVEAAHYEDLVEIDVQPASGWRIVGWSDDPQFDGDHRNIDVFEDVDLTVYLDEVEGVED